MRKILPLLAVLVCFAIPVLSQTKALSGQITDASGAPIPFASIIVKSSKTGVTSDENGNFKINAAAGDVLVISAVGVKTLEYTVGSGNILAIKAEKTGVLEEVVVAAFGVRKEKKALGYSVQEVKGENLTVAKSVDLSSALAGKVAGVTLVGSPSSTFDNASVLIRGVTGLGPVAPIFVLDGTITDQESIIMDNVENVSVLKGPSATAIYGQRAANGVVLITSKKGSRRKTSGVDVNLGVTAETISLLPPYQNEYAGGYTSNASTPGTSYDAAGNYLFKYNAARHPASWAAFNGQTIIEYGADESWGPKMDGRMYRPYYSWYPGDDFGKLSALTPQPNNVKDFFRTGFNYNNSVSFTSGADNYNFKFTYGNQNRSLVIPNAKRDQHQLGVNGAFDIGKALTISTDIIYTTSKTKGKPAEGYDLSGLNITQNFNQWFQRQLDMNRMKQYRQPDGSLNSWNIGDPNGSSDLAVYGKPQYWDNPWFVVNENFATGLINRLVGNVGLNVKLGSHFNLQSYVRMSYNNQENDQRMATGGLQLDYYKTDQRIFREMNYETNLNYRFRFNDFTLDGFVGGNVRNEYFSQLNMSTEGGLSAPNYFDISASIARPTVSRDYRRKRVNSVYGKASLGYQGFLFLDATLRNDWSSALPEINNSYLYPSVSTSFVFTEIMKNSSITNVLSFGKVRASWAQVGSDLGFNQVLLAINNGSLYGSNPSMSIGNQYRSGAVKPALTKSWEVGAELKFLNNRLGLDVGYYRNNNTNQIINLDVSTASGFSTAQVNAGSIVSKGLEVSITGTPVSTRNFSWEVSLNWARNSNKVEQLYQESKTYVYGTARYDTRLEHRVGAEWGMMVGRKWKTDGSGNPIILSTGQPDYLINQDLGQVLPEWTGGMFNALRYQNFDLTFSIDFQKGGLFYSETRNFNTGTGMSEETVGKNDKGYDWRDFPGSYTLAGGNTGNGGIRIPGVFADGKPNNRYISARGYFYTAMSRGAGDFYVLDASYVKLREVRLGYSIPKKVLEHLKVVKNANFGVILSNALLIWANSKKYGIDPSELEVFWREGGQLSQTRQIGVNLRVGF
ncbi:MAG: SusC/RagA family TonB-linked outer membrane protein [Niastella sp.]|nr:SusC/RagA family TonB-linked outer membrane protein [Niastella sp.]